MKKNNARPAQADLIRQIKKIMQKKGLNSSKLAGIIGVSKARISQILDNRANLTLFTVGCLAESLDCDLILRLKRRKKMIGNETKQGFAFKSPESDLTDPEFMLAYIKKLFEFRGDDFMEATYAKIEGMEWIFQAYTRDKSAGARWLKVALRTCSTFDMFIDKLLLMYAELDTKWKVFCDFVSTSDKLILVALMHNPNKTQAEEEKMKVLKDRHFLGMDNAQIIDTYKEQIRKEEAEYMKQITVEAYRDGKELDITKGIGALLDTDIIKLQTDKPGETGKIIYPRVEKAISCVRYDGGSGQTFEAYGEIERLVTSEGRVFYMVGSVFNSDGQALNQIAIPEGSVMLPIREAHVLQNPKTVELKGE